MLSLHLFFCSILKDLFKCVCVQAVTGHEACVEALLQHGASVCVRDSRGRTAMHLAAACGHIGVLGSLLQAAHTQKRGPVIMDSCGYTPLHWACYNGTEHSQRRDIGMVFIY